MYCICVLFFEERIKERLRTSRRFARRMADQTMRDRVFIAVDLKPVPG